MWVIGIIKTTSKKIRVEITFNRNESTIKKIINAHIKTGNHIISDAWAAYNWLDNPFSGYIHSKHNHGHSDFGLGLESTSHFEGLWVQLKNNIRNIYYVIPEDNFLLFLRESEFRRNINNFDSNKKWFELLSIINYINNRDVEDLCSLDYLTEITEPL